MSFDGRDLRRERDRRDWLKFKQEPAWQEERRSNVVALVVCVTALGLMFALSRLF